MKTRPDYGSSSVSQRKGFEHSGMQRRKVITRQVQLHFNLRWEFIRENKKVTKKKRKKLSFFLHHFLGRVLVFLFSCFLTFFFSFINSHFWPPYSMPSLDLLWYFPCSIFSQKNTLYCVYNAGNQDLLMTGACTLKRLKGSASNIYKYIFL